MDRRHGTQSTATSATPAATRAANEERMRQLRTGAGVSQQSTTRKRPGPGEEGDESRGDDTGRGDPQDATTPGRPAPSVPSPPSDAATSSSAAAPPPPTSASSQRVPKRRGEGQASARRVQPERRGEKRATEEPTHPEDPRATDTDNADVSLMNQYSRAKGRKCWSCGSCQKEFESRNLMFEHIRQAQHAVVSDEEDQDVGEVQKSQPGAKGSGKYIKPKDLEWRDIGSGTVAKTLRNASRMWTTTRRGPAIEDVKTRRIWSLRKGVLIDECEVEDTPDSILNRPLPEVDDIRVELILKGAQDLYMQKRPDIAEIY